MSLELVDPAELKSGRGGGKRGTGKRYQKYAIAIGPHVAWLKEQIAASETGVIYVKAPDVAEAMGGEFVTKDDTSVYWGLKYVLFGDPDKFVPGEGIVVDTKTHESGRKVLVMRARAETDVLPDSLRRGPKGKTGETESF